MRFVTHLLAAAAVAVGTIAAAGPAAAEYPDRPVRIVVPFAPGNSADLLARIIADGLQKKLGQPFVVENKPGAGGVIGVQAVTSAKPDGYTLLVSSLSPLVVRPAVAKATPYDTLKDMQPVAMAGLVAQVIVASKDFPAKDFKEMIAAIKANPGKYKYGHFGLGGAGHLLMELLGKTAGFKITGVPYRSFADAQADIQGGQIHILVDGLSGSGPQVTAGNLKGMALSNANRAPQNPDIPTIKESGIPELVNYEAPGWSAVMAPAGTPKDVVNKLNAEIIALFNQAEVKNSLPAKYLEVAPALSADQLGAYIKAELAKWEEAASAAGISHSLE